VPSPAGLAFAQLFLIALLTFLLALGELAWRQAVGGHLTCPLRGVAALVFGHMGEAVDILGDAS
jgi:hypothetical protein